MRMPLNVLKFPAELFRDNRERAALRELYDSFNGVTRILKEILDTTGPPRGIAAIKSRLIPFELDADPTERSTFGQKGELAQFDNEIYQKRNLTAEDTDWQKLIAVTSIGKKFAIRIVTSDPTTVAPTMEEIVVWNRQSTNKGHIWYITGQSGSGAWSYLRLPRFAD